MDFKLIFEEFEDTKGVIRGKGVKCMHNFY
jgi:hypothetical protein